MINTFLVLLLVSLGVFSPSDHVPNIILKSILPISILKHSRVIPRFPTN